MESVWCGGVLSRRALGDPFAVRIVFFMRKKEVGVDANEVDFPSYVCQPSYRRRRVCSR